MNTKSFVNQFDSENVVRGYYDDSGQLVLLEPEGGGGGGDLETATLTVAGNSEISISASFACISTDATGTVIAASNELYVGNTYTIPIYEDGNMLIINKDSSYTFSLEGSYTTVGDNPALTVYHITGDCTVTITTGAE